MTDQFLSVLPIQSMLVFAGVATAVVSISLSLWQLIIKNRLEDMGLPHDILALFIEIPEAFLSLGYFLSGLFFCSSIVLTLMYAYAVIFAFKYYSFLIIFHGVIMLWSVMIVDFIIKIINLVYRENID